MTCKGSSSSPEQPNNSLMMMSGLGLGPVWRCSTYINVYNINILNISINVEHGIPFLRIEVTMLIRYTTALIIIATDSNMLLHFLFVDIH
jgi:hypothetical protein